MKVWEIIKRVVVDGSQITLEFRPPDDRRITAVAISRIKAFLLVDGNKATYEQLGYPLTWGMWDEHFRIKEFYNDAYKMKKNKR